MRYKKMISDSGIEMQALAKEMGISYRALNSRMNPKEGRDMSIETYKLMADALGVHFFEMFDPPEGFVHIYDQNGNWRGIDRDHGKKSL